MYVKTINAKQVFFTSGSIITETGVIINPTEEQLIENGWSLYIEPEPSAEELLANAKAEKIAQIETYDSSENVEQFIINGTPMWLGHELRQQIRTSADAYSAMGYENMTKVFNGVEFTFPIAVWIQMLNALEIYAAEALNATERHKNNINAMDSVQDIINYDYTTGYPLKLAFGEVED
jgi:hypothetical protein